MIATWVQQRIIRSGWILLTGIWNDAGEWIDTQVWID